MRQNFRWEQSVNLLSILKDLALKQHESPTLLMNDFEKTRRTF